MPHYGNKASRVDAKQPLLAKKRQYYTPHAVRRERQKLSLRLCLLLGSVNFAAKINQGVTRESTKHAKQNAKASATTTTKTTAT
jgi:hypothetical protein